MIYKEWYALGRDIALGGNIIYYIKFILLWISYNGYYSPKYSGKDYDRAVLNAPNSFGSLDISTLPSVRSFYDYILNKSRNKGCIYDLKHEKPVYAKEISILNYFELVYQIRNNLFHGGKSLEDEIDRDLVLLASSSLEKILVNIM